MQERFTDDWLCHPENFKSYLYMMFVILKLSSTKLCDRFIDIDLSSHTSF